MDRLTVGIKGVCDDAWRKCLHRASAIEAEAKTQMKRIPCATVRRAESEKNAAGSMHTPLRFTSSHGPTCRLTHVRLRIFRWLWLGGLPA